MRWYEGDIADAVAVSKTRNAIFVVYVEGKDDRSTSLTSLINQNEISSKLESDQFVAIKLEAESVLHNQFAAIYKNVPVPSIFFIGRSGKAIDIVAEPSTITDLSTKIDEIVDKHDMLSPTPSTQSTASTISEELIKSEQTETSIQIPEKDVCENGVCHKIADKPSTSNQTQTDFDKPEDKSANNEFLEKEKKELSKEEKIQRAKELVEMKRQAKQQEEEEAQKLKEIERRKMGQDVQKMKRLQQDQDLKNIMDEHQRERNEEKAARERILAQIAQDKVDRAARFSSSPPATVVTPVVETSAPVVRPFTANSNTARLQFRLPDGSSNTKEFMATSTLQEVREYVQHNLNLPYRNFTMSTTFPRREFVTENDQETLKDLELLPNAVILILPGHSSGAVTSHQDGTLTSLFWLLLSPFLSVYGYFRNLIFGQPQTGSQPPKRTNTENDQQQAAIKRKMMESTVVRRQGNSNIHRLSDRTDSDDDNNTWNGNSTQQM